ncbi:MAG TPA: alkaline phosphatase family protein [Actinomycetes bacterium]|jgi:predicted AlkP superfamily phosphohydrolase/phosphomutase|nr:alkaline phosphatase family protein [Actinomycetes bacterium]
MAAPARVAVVGLDCGTPELLFDRHADDMPTLRKLTEQALWGPLRSVVPPITVPAWSCMASGLTPGELGVYGFRNRSDHSYDKLAFATSKAIKVPRLWDRLGAAGGQSVVLGVPGTYPPSAIQGCMVSCFMAPSTDAAFTHPPELRDEVQQVTGGYVLDVADFRSDDKARVAQQVFDMTEQRFELARHLATTRPWDLFWFVDMGPDRLHHGFWSHCDPSHPRHEPGNRHAGVFTDYYRALDRHLASFLEALPDDTAVLVVSDHGAQPMLGGFRFNQWLVDQGLLVLAEAPAGPTPVNQARIDWSRTTAWGDGGYYGRLFLNVEGREPTGTVPASRYEEVRQELVDALESLVDHRGHRMGTRALRPEEVYPEVRGVAPDLVVYFGDLRWRAVGSIGHGPGLFTFENDTGPDDANHAENGVFALVGDGLPSGRRADLSIYDVAPTLQRMLGLPATPGQRGRIVA